jgi:branched-chain amino acid transport system permease protein
MTSLVSQATPVCGDIAAVIQHVFDALSTGSLYAMLALGIALIFGIVRLVNFAQGAIIMGSAYAILAVADWPVAGKLGIAILVAIFLSLVVNRVAFQPIRDSPPSTLMVTSFTLGTFFQAVAEMADNNHPRSTSVSTWLDESFHFGSVVITHVSLITLVTTILLVAALAVYLRKARIGTEMRAAAENFRMAQALGIRSNRVIMIAFIFSGVLAGVSSFFLVAQSGTINPDIGTTPLIIGLVATVIGGLGSLPGAVVGGFLLGAATEILQAALPASLTPYTNAFVFGAVFVLLVTRPQGIFGSTAGERV